MNGIVATIFRQLRRGWARGFGIASLCALAVQLAGCAWLDTEQRELVYRPTPGRPVDFQGLRPGDVDYAIHVPSARAGSLDRLQLWWLPNPDPQAPALLYLHGTFRSLYQNLRKVEALRQAGYAVLAVEYRGWGDSSAIVPSESSIDADANSAWAELERHQANPRKRVIYGHSLGSGVAVELASHKHAGVDYGGLILESSFTSLPDVAKAAGWLGTVGSWFATQEFNSLAKIGRVDAPILMLHGTADRTVPIELGRRLYRAAPAGTRWIEFPGGSHSELDSESPQAYRDAVHSLIEQLR